MNANETVAVVLAAPGARSLWRTQLSSVLIGGIPTLVRVRRALSHAGVRDVCLIADETGSDLGAPWTRVIHREDSDMAAALAAFSGGRRLLVLCGDLPLLTATTVHAFIEASSGARAPRFVEASGVMAVFHSSDDAAKAIGVARDEDGAPALGPCGDGTWGAADPDDVRRFTSPADYSAASRVAYQRKAAALAAAGVLIADAARTYVDDDVSVAAGAVLLPGTHIRGESAIGANCSIGPDSWIESSVVGEGATVRYSVLEGARVRERTTVGPFAHLRRGSDIGPDARIGNFVEVKASRLGSGVKAGHLSYIGDADVGDDVNIGAGAITCNFDGEAKHRTAIEDDVFVGTHVSLIAPVTVGRGAFLAAGSTITDDVPPGALAIARARQVNKEPKQAGSREDT